MQYKGKSYYLYTPVCQRDKANILSWRCTIYRHKECIQRGRNNKLCYGTITYNKTTKEVCLSNNHSEYCNELNKEDPINLADVNNEILKKERLLNIMNEYFNKNPTINLVNFSKECLKKYNELQCKFNITDTTWKNMLNKIKYYNNNSIDIILKKNKTLDGYQFFRKSNYIYNPFLKKDKISKYIIWVSDYNINRIKNNFNFYIDGTFVRPVSYQQTLIFMYFDEQTELYVPGIYILMNNKLKSSYIEIFNYINSNILNNINENNKNITITLDFESGLIESIKEVFFNAKMVGCYFHFKQALVRNAKKLGFGKNNYKNKLLQLINNELGILPFKYNGNLNYITNKLKEYNNTYKEFTSFLEYFKNEWITYFKNNMFLYNILPKKVRTNNALESLNGRIKKFTNYKCIISWLEYMTLLLNLEDEYKKKIITLESTKIKDITLPATNIKGSKSINKQNNIKKNSIYFFKWKYNSCRFDSILFILYYKLINLFDSYKFNRNNDILNNLYSLCEEYKGFKNINYKAGFFDSYYYLKKDYLNLKNNLVNLQHDDTITSACVIFNGIDELITNYKLTEYCANCNPVGITSEKTMNLVYIFDKNDLINSISLEELLKQKFIYKNSSCPKCGYTKEGISLNKFNLISIVSNIKLPPILFFCIEAINLKILDTIKDTINKIFVKDVLIMDQKYELASIVYICLLKIILQLQFLIIKIIIIMI